MLSREPSHTALNRGSGACQTSNTFRGPVVRRMTGHRIPRRTQVAPSHPPHQWGGPAGGMLPTQSATSSTTPRTLNDAGQERSSEGPGLMAGRKRVMWSKARPREETQGTLGFWSKAMPPATKNHTPSMDMLQGDQVHLAHKRPHDYVVRENRHLGTEPALGQGHQLHACHLPSRHQHPPLSSYCSHTGPTAS